MNRIHGIKAMAGIASMAGLLALGASAVAVAGQGATHRPAARVLADSSTSGTTLTPVPSDDNTSWE
jgi:hypothetical protein